MTWNLIANRLIATVKEVIEEIVAHEHLLVALLQLGLRIALASKFNHTIVAWVRLIWHGFIVHEGK